MNHILSAGVLKLKDDDILANLGKVHAVSDRMSVRGTSLLLTQLPRPSSICGKLRAVSRQAASPISISSLWHDLA